MLGKIFIWGMTLALSYVSIVLSWACFKLSAIDAKTIMKQGSEFQAQNTYLVHHDSYIRLFPGVTVTFNPHRWAAVIILAGVVMLAIGFVVLLHIPSAPIPAKTHSE